MHPGYAGALMPSGNNTYKYCNIHKTIQNLSHDTLKPQDAYYIWNNFTIWRKFLKQPYGNSNIFRRFQNDWMQPDVTYLYHCNPMVINKDQEMALQEAQHHKTTIFIILSLDWPTVIRLQLWLTMHKTPPIWCIPQISTIQPYMASNVGHNSNLKDQNAYINR